MCKTISHAVNACSFKYKLFCFKMSNKIQNQYMKDILSKAFITHFKFIETRPRDNKNL